MDAARIDAPAAPADAQDTRLLRINRRRIHLDDANDLLRELVAHIERCPHDADIDLSEVRDATSVAVAVLVRAAQIARRTGKRLIVRAGSPIIHGLLRMNKLERLFHFRSQRPRPRDRTAALPS